MTNSKPRFWHDWTRVDFAVIAVVALGSTAAFLAGLWMEIGAALAGDLKVHDPVQACVIRAPRDGSGADLLIVRTTIENSGGEAKTIHALTLDLRGTADKHRTQHLRMLGLFPEDKDFSPAQTYAPGAEVTVAGHAARSVIIAFGAADDGKAGAPPSAPAFDGRESWQSWLSYELDGKRVHWDYSKVFLNVPAGRPLAETGASDTACWRPGP